MFSCVSVCVLTYYFYVFIVKPVGGGVMDLVYGSSSSFDKDCEVKFVRGYCRFAYVTQAYFGSRVNWIYDPAPPAPHRATLHSGNIPVLASNNEASAIATRGSSGAPLTPSLPKKCRRRRRRQARRAANRNRAPSSAAPVTPDERWANQRTGRSGATQPLLEGIDPTSRMRTAEYPHSQIISRTLISAANENSPFHLGLESGEFPGLYKPAVPDQRQDSTARTFRVNNSGSGISSPPYLHPTPNPSLDGLLGQL